MAHRQRQLGGLDADGADVIASHAGKTTIHLLDKIGAEFELPFQPFASQCHTSTGRGGFLVILPIRGADRQSTIRNGCSLDNRFQQVFPNQ